MRLEVDPAALRTAADRLRGAGEQARLAHAGSRGLGPAQPWAPDLGVQGAFSRAQRALESMTAVAATACTDLTTDLERAAAGYEATEGALSRWEQHPR